MQVSGAESQGNTASLPSALFDSPLEQKESQKDFAVDFWGG